MKDVYKKRKAAAAGQEDPNASSPAKKKSAATAPKKDTPSLSSAASKNSSSNSSDFKPLSLKEIHDRVKELADQVPEIPEEGFYNEGASPNAKSSVLGHPPENLNKELIKSWASQLQVVLEELGLLLCCVSTATYRWGTDRTGAADQNLALLNEELNSTQDQIASRVTPRLRNVLTPVVDLVVEKTVTTRRKRPKQDDGEEGNKKSKKGGSTEEDDEVEWVEEKRNVFTRHLEDPDFVHLCYEILARNASMMRLVVITNFQKMLQCINDYLAAQNNESQHHREFAY